MEPVTGGTLISQDKIQNKVRDVLTARPGTEAEFVARIHAICQRDPEGDSVVLLVRDDGNFLSVVITKHELRSRSGVSWDAAQKCTCESIVRVHGIKLDEDNCHAIRANSLMIISMAVDNLPRGVLRSAPFEEKTPKDSAEAPSLRERLDNRVLDMRVAANAAVFKILSGVIELSTEYCMTRGFLWIPTPVMVGHKIPHDEDYIPVSYIGGQQAWLVQTAEIHQQMVLSMDVSNGKVFEIRTNMRAEKRMTTRHLTEFTALEILMTLQHWTDLLDESEEYFVFVIRALLERQKYQDAIQAAKRVYPSTGTFKLGFDDKGRLPRLTHRNAKLLARQFIGDKEPVELDVDFTIEEEAALGKLMRDQHGTDAFIVTEFPTSLRPWNVTPSASVPNATNSFDFILRGEEAATCYQIMHDRLEVRAAMAKSGFDLDAPMWQPFLSAFDAAVMPHGCIAVGLNRVVKAFLGLDDIQEAAMFPRNAARLMP